MGWLFGWHQVSSSYLLIALEISNCFQFGRAFFLCLKSYKQKEASCVLLVLNPHKSVEIEMLWFVNFISDYSIVKCIEKEFYCMWEFQLRYNKTGKMLWRSSEDSVFSLIVSKNLILTIHVFKKILL